MHRHAAEKLHAMLMDHGERENTRVRDLVDLVILTERDLLEPTAVGAASARVWSEREGAAPPPTLPPLPASWPRRYETLARELGLGATTFPAAVSVVTALWSEMFPTKEN